MGLLDWLRPRQQVPADSQLRASALTDEGNVIEDAGDFEQLYERIWAQHSAGQRDSIVRDTLS